jgi:hypothetical protein
MFLIRSDTPDARSHVELRVLAHAVGIALRAAAVGFDGILHALQQRSTVLLDAFGLVHAGEQRQRRFVARVGLWYIMCVCVLCIICNRGKSRMHERMNNYWWKEKQACGEDNRREEIMEMEITPDECVESSRVDSSQVVNFLWSTPNMRIMV